MPKPMQAIPYLKNLPTFLTLRNDQTDSSFICRLDPKFPNIEAIPQPVPKNGHCRSKIITKIHPKLHSKNTRTFLTPNLV